MQFSRLVKYAASAGSLQGTHNFAEAPARYYSSEPSLQETEETGCVNFQLQSCDSLLCARLCDCCRTCSTYAKIFLYVRFKGHSMLAPFTAGWQSTDLHPLVIERSEVSSLCHADVVFFFYLLQCTTRFWKMDNSMLISCCSLLLVYFTLQHLAYIAGFLRL
jgi:hypothetical protein